MAQVGAVGRAGFPGLLIESRLVSRNDLAVAEQHAAGKRIDLVDALVALRLASERECYQLLARASAVPFMSLEGYVFSELAIRLVPEKLARRGWLVPLLVDNRTLTYATCQPLNDREDPDLAFASGRRTSVIVATRSDVTQALDRCYPKSRQLDILAGRIKADRPAAETSVVDGARSPERSKRRVLVTDDEPITRMLVKLLLEKEQFDVLEASNGRQAVDIAVRERPDLVLIDLNMPEMDGYDAIAKMRRDRTLAQLPIVVLTSEEGPGVERRVLELGADDYLLKPFDPAVLLSRVNAVFRRIKAVAA